MKHHLRSVTIQRLTALAVASAFLFALALAASPQLHASLHKESGALQHECAVTLIACGSYEHSAAPVVFVAPQPADYFATIATVIPVWVAAPFLGGAIFEHAPPALA